MFLGHRVQRHRRSAGVVLLLVLLALVEARSARSVQGVTLSSLSDGVSRGVMFLVNTLLLLELLLVGLRIRGWFLPESVILTMIS